MAKLDPRHPDYNRHLQEKANQIRSVQVLPPGFKYEDNWSCCICKAPRLGETDLRPAFLCKRCEQITCLRCYDYEKKVCLKCAG